MAGALQGSLDRSGTWDVLPISRRYSHFVFGVLQAGMTSGVASAIASLPLLGSWAFVQNWLGSWLLAWAAIVPLVIVVAPVIRRLSLVLTVENDRDRSKPGGAPHDE